MSWIATLTLAAAVQGVVHGRPDRLKLPEVRPPKAQQQPETDPAVQDPRAREFLDRVLELRRSLRLARDTEDARIHRIGEEFADAAQRALELMRQVEPDVQYALLRVLRFYGEPEHARELKYLLLTRPIGQVTEQTVETMAVLARGEAKEFLFECLVASRDAVRRHAMPVLEPMLDDADAGRLVTLSRQGGDDVQVKALQLLGALPLEAPRKRLLDALGQRERHAEAACQSLIRHGEPAVGDLQELCRQPPVSPAFAYAVFALASLELGLGRELIDDGMRDYLLRELDEPMPFRAAVAGLALARLSWRSAATDGEVYRDGQAVDAMLAVVAPRQFVVHFAMLRDPLVAEVTRFTGKDFGLAAHAWRSWWEGFEPTEYVGTRRRVDVTAENATAAELVWATGRWTVRLRGPDAAVDPAGDDTLDILLDGEAMHELVADLERDGFMGGATAAAPAGDPRRLRLRLYGARCQTEPATPPRMLDRLGARIDRRVEAERWQLYRDPVAEPDFAAFWRSERRWRQQHPDAAARQARLRARIVGAVGRLRGSRLDLAIAHLAAIERLAETLTEAEGLALVAAIGAHEVWDERSQRLMDLALRTPGDTVWRELLRVVDDRFDAGGDEVLRRLFGLMDHDRLIACFGPENPLAVRLAAMDEIASMRDVQAVQPLLAALDDDDPVVRETVVFALGKIGASSVRQPLLDMLRVEGDALPPQVRRAAWVALARIGGPEVFAVLQGAARYRESEDRVALVRALGALDDPAAARELANVFALRGEDPIGELALSELQGKGDLGASFALAPLLEHSAPAVRRRAALALGEFQSPAALPLLIGMLDSPLDEPRAVALIASTTGVDLTARNDRAPFIREWYDRHRGLPQSTWFVMALETAGEVTRLDPAQLGHLAGSAAVPELARLLTECKVPHLRVLACRILRVVTGEDYGTASVFDDPQRLQAIADRYRFHADAAKAAAGR